MKLRNKLYLYTFLFLVSLFATAQEENFNKVAIISIFASKELKAPQFPTLGKALAKLADDKNFSLQNVVDEFRTKFFSEFSKEFPFAFLAEDSVIKAKDYRPLWQYNGIAIDTNWYAHPVGYLTIMQNIVDRNEKIITKSFEAIPPVDGVMLAYLDFELIKDFEMFGMGTARVRAYINLKIYDKKMNKVFVLRENATSNKTIEFALGGVVFKAEDLQPLISESLVNLYKDMKETLPKRLEKMKKKLQKIRDRQK